MAGKTRIRRRGRWLAGLALAASLAWALGTGAGPGPESPPAAAPASTAVAAPATSIPPAGKLRPPSRPLRALQVIRLECRTWAEVEQRLVAFKAAGVQAIILRVFHNPGDGAYGFIQPAAEAGVYFQARDVPVVADVLGPMCELAHRHGLLVIAWMTSRYANYGHESETELRCMAWDFGQKRAAPRQGYCPLLPEVHDRLANLYSDLARYPIDGVLLQDDLILKHTEGMNPRARELYQKATGKAADPELFYRQVRALTDGKYAVGEYTPAFDEWCRWKNRMLLLLAERLRRTVQARRPSIPVGINLFYETVADRGHSLAWFAQDLDATLDSDLDFYALMFYHRQMEKELRLPRAEVFNLIDASLASLLEKVDYPQRVWVKVQSVDWDTGARLPSSEVAGLLDRAGRRGPVGLVIVPVNQSLDLDMVKQSFKVNGG